MNYTLASYSRRGSRHSNQDRTLTVERGHALLLALADGVGGHAGGAIAAEIAMETLGRAFRQRRQSRMTHPHQFLEVTFGEAHDAMRQAGLRTTPPSKPRTTCVACIVQDGYAYWAHVGDSRLYHLHRGRVAGRTQDHTEVDHLRRAGVVDGKEAREHPDRSRLSACLGSQTTPEARLGGPVALAREDLLLLCSDGLWEAVGGRELAARLRGASLEESLEELIVTAEERRFGHGDNVSAVALCWQDARPDGHGGRERITQPVSPKPAAPAAVVGVPDASPALDNARAELSKEIADLEALMRQRRP